MTSTTFKRSVLTMNLDGRVRNVDPKETVPIIGCQFNLRIWSMIHGLWLGNWMVHLKTVHFKSWHGEFQTPDPWRTLLDRPLKSCPIKIIFKSTTSLDPVFYIFIFEESLIENNHYLWKVNSGFYLQFVLLVSCYFVNAISDFLQTEIELLNVDF